MYHGDLGQVSADKAGKTGWNQPLSWFRSLLKLSQAHLSYCMTLCFLVKTAIPMSICLTSAFVLFPLWYMDFQNHLLNENRCLSWWSIHNTTLFLLHFSTLSWIAVFVYMQVKDTFKSEATNKSRNAPVQTAQSQLKNSSEAQCQEFHSLTSNQIPQLLHASIIKETPQTPDQKSLSSGLTYLNMGHQTMQVCPYCIKWVPYFNSVSMPFLAQLNIETVRFCFNGISYYQWNSKHVNLHSQIKL